MADYDEAQRKKYATVGKDRYPIGNKAHARLALAMINKGGLSHDQKMKVIDRAHAVLSGKK